MANINVVIDEVAKLNPDLARQIQKYVKTHSYGLVYENNLPEAVRLYNKNPTVGDTVNILPERGKQETEKNKVPWIIKEIQDKGLEHFVADGMTPMGTAIQMAKDMIDDKSVTPSRIYRPAVVLVSDGEPNDDWRNPMAMFINDGRSSKCQRFAVAIGEKADRTVLETFTENSDNVFYAANASDLAECFKTVSMSVTTTATKPEAPKSVAEAKTPVAPSSSVLDFVLSTVSVTTYQELFSTE